MKLKLFKKYFLTTTVIILLSIGFMLLIVSFALNNYITNTKKDSLGGACNEIVSRMEAIDGVGRRDVEILYESLRSVANVSNIEMFITDNKNRVVICSCDDWISDNECTHTANPISNELFDEKNKDGNFYISTAKVYPTPHYIAAKSVYANNESVLFTVFSTAPISEVRGLLGTIIRMYFIAAIVPIIIMFFGLYAMTYRLTKPLKQMSLASRAMARGDFSKRIPVTTDDEIGELAASFNMMTNSLAQLEGMRKSFVANVSHELKTPMTTIGGFIDGILDGTIETEKQKYYLNLVSSEVKRLSRLVESMLNMARLESGEMTLKREAFDLSELLCTVAISQEQRIEQKNLEILGLDSLKNVTVYADKDLMHQAVYNLVDNAIKFANKNGKIEFSVEGKNGICELKIKNTGKGIPEKDIPYIFERFYKVDKSRSASKNSTGLGLYIVKTIVNVHGGKVAVSSKENEFTSFKIALPIEI